MDMDFREPTRHYPQQPAYREAPQQQQQQPQYNDPPPQHHRKGGKGKAFFKFLLVLLLIAGAAAGAWYYRDKQAKDDAAKQAQQISDLQDQLNTARDAANAAKTQAQADTTQTTGPSADTLKKAQDAISNAKYADLKVLMSDKVNVVIAASDGLGARTPDQAVSDLKYLASTKDWDFKLVAKTVATYQDGAYSVYFPAGALVGKSSDGHVVSLVFNDAGKITGIFMAPNEKTVQ